jgi:hypothetical protein
MQETAAAMPEERKAATAEDAIREIDEEWKEKDRWMLEKYPQEIARRLQERERWRALLGERTFKILDDLVLIDPAEAIEDPSNLLDKFNEMNFDFKLSSTGRRYSNSKFRPYEDVVDIMLENTSTVMAVIVRNQLRASDVQDFIETMGILRACADENDDRFVWLGAVAGVFVSNDVYEAAYEAGFYLIEQFGGDTVMISVPEGFKPKEWIFHAPF